VHGATDNSYYVPQPYTNQSVFKSLLNCAGRVCTKKSVIYINDIYHDKYHDFSCEKIMIFININIKTKLRRVIKQLSNMHTVFLANVNSCSCSLYMSSSVRLSVVCLSSVCNVRALLSRLKFSAMFLRHLIRW